MAACHCMGPRGDCPCIRRGRGELAHPFWMTPLKDMEVVEYLRDVAAEPEVSVPLTNDLLRAAAEIERLREALVEADRYLQGQEAPPAYTPERIRFADLLRKVGAALAPAGVTREGGDPSGAP